MDIAIGFFEIRKFLTTKEASKQVESSQQQSPHLTAYPESHEFTHP